MHASDHANRDEELGRYNTNAGSTLDTVDLADRDEKIMSSSGLTDSSQDPIFNYW
jgi:hypothetical protein